MDNSERSGSMNKLWDFLAHFFSILLLPILLPTYGYLFLFTQLPEASVYDFWFLARFLGIVFLFTFLLPGLSFVFLKKLGLLSSLGMGVREERYYPMLITGFVYIGFLYFITNYLQFGGFFATVQLATTVSLVITAVITYWWKISAHSVGIGGMVGVLVAYQLLDHSLTFLVAILISVLLWGCLASSRLHLNAHTPAQVYAGSLLGFLSSLLVVYFLA